MPDSAPPPLDRRPTRPTDPAPRPSSVATGGEHAELGHRVVVAPSAGRFQPDPDVGPEIRTGERIGWLHHAGAVVDVGSPWAGRFAGHLVDDRERVRDAQPLALVHPLASSSHR